MAARSTLTCLLLALLCLGGRTRNPRPESADCPDPYAPGCGTDPACPPGTAFDASRAVCAQSDRPARRSKRSADEPLKVVCYYAGWGVYRPEEGKFTPEDVDPFLCTHVVYSFAALDEKSYLMKAADYAVDVVDGSFQKVVRAKQKNPKLKVLLAIGGWTDSLGGKYSQMVGHSDRRKQFVERAVLFLKEYGFDGLDLDWEFPVCWQGDCQAGPHSDREDFARLLKQLRKAFDQEKPPLLLSAAVNAGKSVSDAAYDADSLSKYLDFVNVMAYDFRNFLDGKTGHHAPFRYHPGDADQQANAVACMRYWSEERKVPRRKLILGVPAYGRTFTLADSSVHGPLAPTIGPGRHGPYTNENGSLSYTEIRQKIEKRGWKKVREPDVGPYAYGDDQWVGYDDPVSAKEKGRWVRDQGYGGVMVWELSSDDFRGTWSPKKYPLINALKEGLLSGSAPLPGGWLWLAAVLIGRSVHSRRF